LRQFRRFVQINGQQHFTQIGFVVLVGLACKNAILIVEFAKQQMDAGHDRMDAAVRRLGYVFAPS